MKEKIKTIGKRAINIGKHVTGFTIRFVFNLFTIEED